MSIDGHKSHLTLHLSKFCAEHEIVLIALHPNATHIIQPLYISFFRTLKSNRQQINKSISDISASISIQKYEFAPILKQTPHSIDCKKLLESGFRKCGLYSFNVNNIDFSELFDKNKSQIAPETFENYSAVVEQNVNSRKYLKVYWRTKSYYNFT